jgi:transposase
VLVSGAVIRIAKEMIKFNFGVDYVSSMLMREVEEAKIESGQFDFNPGEWREDTREKVLGMLQEGKSHAEIISKLEVSESYIKGVTSERIIY